ncbi:MAG: TIGR00282 family metallophosphoesterase [Pseudomonadota bacterium]
MKIIFLGDIVGKTGLEVMQQELPPLKRQLKPDFTIANGENISSGNGISPKSAEQIFNSGVDIITTGNHVWDRIETLSLLESNKPVLRPYNFPVNTPGRGYIEINSGSGEKLLVINLQAQLFMGQNLNDPFSAADEILSSYKLKNNIDAIFVDFHGEATAEKMALGQYLDGRVSAIVGTHTHVPTSDTHILPSGTAYQTDAGMCGDYNSVVGFEPMIAVQRFTTKRKVYERGKPASGAATLCGNFVKINHRTGLASSIEPIRIGGVLPQVLPVG